MLILGKQPSPILQLLLHHRTKQALAALFVISASRQHLLLDERGQKRIGVYLPMWMRYRHPNLFALILEDKNVLHKRVSRQLFEAVGPHLHQLRNLLHRQVCHFALMLRSIQYHLAYSLRWDNRSKRGTLHRRLRSIALKRGKAIFKNHNLVIGIGYLCLYTPRLRGTERAILFWGQESALLAVRGGNHPLLQIRMPPQLRHLCIVLHLSLRSFLTPVV
ncbi:hypothetical protein HRbin16_01879 [bacterium HR16]|nr:hypothetical protein HRbin16_01879 [bacterium HR16]